MGFKVFEEYGAAARDGATLRVSGYLFLSKGLLRRVDAENAQGARLLYDEEGACLGVEFYDDYDKNRTEIRALSREKSGSAINILPLLRFYGYGKPIEKQTLKVEKQGAMLVMDLSMLSDEMKKPYQQEDVQDISFLK